MGGRATANGSGGAQRSGAKPACAVDAAHGLHDAATIPALEDGAPNMLLLRVAVRNNRFQTAAVFAANGEGDTGSHDETSSAHYDNPSFRAESHTSEEKNTKADQERLFQYIVCLVTTYTIFSYIVRKTLNLLNILRELRTQPRYDGIPRSWIIMKEPAR